MSWVIESEVPVRHSEQTYMRGTLRPGDEIVMARAATDAQANIDRLVAAGVEFARVNNLYTFDRCSDSQWQAAADALGAAAIDVDLDRTTPGGAS